MKATYGTFLLIGETIAPKVAYLSEARTHYLYDRLRMANTRASNPAEASAQVHRDVFKLSGIEYAIPAWVQDSMMRITCEYEGEYQDTTRILAAMLLENCGRSAPSPKDPKGGQPAVIDAPKPRKPTGGNAVAVGKAKQRVAIAVA